MCQNFKFQNYLPTDYVYHSFCAFISNFLSGHCISAMVDAHCSSPKHINSDVHMALFSHLLFSFYSLIIFLKQTVLSTIVSMNLLSITPFLKPTRTIHLNIISQWGKRGLVSNNGSKTQSLYLLTRHNLLIDI